MSAVKPEELTALRGVVSPLDRVEEVLCSQAKGAGYLFAVVRVRSGAYCAVWEQNAHAYETVEEMLAAQDQSRMLNCYEKELLRHNLHVEAKNGEAHQPRARDADRL